MITQVNICRRPARPGESCDTLGLAELGTMCNPHSCAIVQVVVVIIMVIMVMMMVCNPHCCAIVQVVIGFVCAAGDENHNDVDVDDCVNVQSA